jgi:hypothetical protein
MNHSFKFIVNPSDVIKIEITSFLQYCALKNILSKFTSNNIKPLKNNKNLVLFDDKVTDASFTKYIQMTQSEKEAFKTSCLKDVNDSSLFFDAISEIEYSGSFKDLRKPLEPQGPLEHNSNDSDEDEGYTVSNLYTIFMNHEHAKKYLLKYVPKNSEEVRYIRMHGINDSSIIYYDDCYINFYIVDLNHEDEEDHKEYTKLVDCINTNTYLLMFMNKFHLENIYDDVCVYTEDPDTIHKVLMDNQAIIDTMASNISYMDNGLIKYYLHVYNVFNELQTSITNVANAYESTKKDVEDKLAVLKGLS